MTSPYFTPDHETFRQAVRQFIDSEVAPHANDWEANQQIPHYIWEKMGDLGFLGVNFPEEWGGTNNDFFYSVVLLEEIPRSLMGGFAAAHGVHQFMSTAHILKAGSDFLKKKYVVDAISGKKLGALAITEPFAGSDVMNIRTTAKRVGDKFVINGSKIFITNGVYSDFVTVACKTDPDAGAAGISLIVVDRNTPGFSATKLKKVGWHSSDTGELAFDNVEVPAENLVGNENHGFYYIMDSFQSERLITAIGSISACEHGMALTLKYMNEREAFGRQLKKFQVLRHKLVDLATEIEATKQLVYHTSWLYDKGIYCVKECSMAKLKATELSKRVSDECLQIFGGYGYMDDFPISRMFRDARVGTIVGGTSEIMREILAKIIIDEVNFSPAYGNEKEQAPTSPSPSNSSNQSITSNQSPSMDIKPETAKDIIYSLPQRLKAEKAANANAIFQFDIEGPNGGQFTAKLENGVCTVSDGLTGTPNCMIKAKDKDYEDVELGRTNAQMAVMMGKVKISNIGEMLKFIELFKRLG
jgi:alkylation response protein AidB-like acyl-CoA dehydrogenase/putative sterol carrier protein